MKFSILLPGVQRPEQMVPFANIVKWTAAERLWLGQGVGLDSYQVAAWLAGAGVRVPIGFGVSLMPLRSPLDAACAARSLAMLVEHDVVAGFGPGPAEAQLAGLGRHYESPLAASREYLTAVRGLLGSGPVDAAVPYDYYAPPECALPSLGPLRIEVGLGVLRAKMASLAREVADCAISWLLPAKHLHDVMGPILHGGGNPGAGGTRLVAIVPVGLVRNGRDRIRVAEAAVGRHLAAPHYRSALRQAGMPLVGDKRADLEIVVAEGVIAFGDVQEVEEHLDRYRSVGVDEVVINVNGVAELYGIRSAYNDIVSIVETAKDLVGVR